MRVAIVALTDFDTASSTVRRVQMIGKGLTACGHDVHIIIPQRFRPGLLLETMDGLTIHWGTIATTEEWTKVLSRLQARWAAMRLVITLAKDGLDWLILYNLGLEGLPLLLAARHYGTRVAAEYCDVRVRPKHPRLEDRTRVVWQGLADALVPRYTDLNIAISRFLEQWLRAKAWKTPTLIVPPLVNTDLFRIQSQKAQSFREGWRLDSVPIIAYLGSYWEVEGVATLLKSASALATAGEQFKLVISGAMVRGRDCDNVSDLIDKMDLNRYVVQTGWLPTEEVIAAMSAADILVVPKTDDIANQAGVATKMVEYLSMGRAVVATCVGDVPLYLHDGENALLCEPGNPAELAGKLGRLLNEPAERLRLGTNARQTALDFFDYRSAGRQIDMMMRQIHSGLR